jgi:hypothetical protein
MWNQILTANESDQAEDEPSERQTIESGAQARQFLCCGSIS